MQRSKEICVEDLFNFPIIRFLYRTAKSKTCIVHEYVNFTERLYRPMYRLHNLNSICYVQ